MFTQSERFRIRTKVIGLGLMLTFIGIAVWLWYACTCSSRVLFLPHHAPAEWIVYPKPPSGHVQAWTDSGPSPELQAIFRHSLSLEKVPASARVKWRAFRSCSITINNVVLPAPVSDPNWKAARDVEISQYLHAGENAIQATVSNHGAPPGLWLSLEGDGCSLSSDTSWEVSYEGALWRPAALASDAPKIREGNPLYGGETTLAGVRARGGFLAVLCAIATGLVVLVRKFVTQAFRPLVPPWMAGYNPATVTFLLIAVVWVALALHNLYLLPPRSGFDHDGHVEYIAYIQKHAAVPPSQEGWETFQPPLYYMLSAIGLNCLHLTANSPDGETALRLFSLAIGLAHLSVIFAGLRLLFPSGTMKQIIGLLLAGFVPMHLYLSHFVTNEVLNSCLVCATVVLLLWLATNDGAGAGSYVGVGLCLGLAMLTKVTSVILVPLVGAVLLFKWLTAPRGFNRWVLPMLTIVIFFSCCGWYYWRTWQQSGHSLFATLRWEYGVSYYQDPGYQTASRFFRFGRCLTEPFYSGLSSYADGVYSTVWGDGLWSGVSAAGWRLPWDYHLIAAGFLLALLPTALILLGFALVFWKFTHQPQLVWLILSGFWGALMLALLYWNLVLPNYAVARGFYCLSGLLALCAFAGVGYEFLARRAERFAIGVLSLIIVWAGTSYASLWIRPNLPRTQAMLAQGFLQENDTTRAVACLEKALKTDPTSVDAGACLFDLMIKQGRVSEAAEYAGLMIRQHPSNASFHLNLALALERRGDTEQAIEHTRTAVSLAPDDPSARLNLAARLCKMRRFQEAISASREGLRILPAEQAPHLLLATALLGEASQNEPAHSDLGGPGAISEAVEQDPVEEAIDHLRFVLSLSENNYAALERLAWTLATWPNKGTRNGLEAVRLAERACKLTEFRNPSLLITLAAARSEAGQDTEANEALRKAGPLVEAAGDELLHERYREVSESVRHGQPYRRTCVEFFCNP